MRGTPLRAIALGTILGVAGLMTASAQTQGPGWVTVFDGTSLDAFNTVGNANWRLADGVVEATEGSGFLVTKDSYADFELRVEFWADEGANSGVYMRCQDAAKITDKTCYEANIFDKRPDPSGRTGAIVHVAKPLAQVDAAGRWNTYEITLKGPELHVRLNGIVTAQAQDSRLTKGPIALQHQAGTVRFRRVEIRPL